MDRVKGSSTIAVVLTNPVKGSSTMAMGLNGSVQGFATIAMGLNGSRQGVLNNCRGLNESRQGVRNNCDGLERVASRGLLLRQRARAQRVAINSGWNRSDVMVRHRSVLPDWN